MLSTALLLAGAFFAITSRLLPLKVAVNFDERGAATSFLSVHPYCWLIALMGLALPLAVVSVLHVAYDTARTLRVPNSKYWLSPPRLSHTRAYRKAHGAWLGVMLSLLMAFIYWLIVSANTLEPAQLATQTLLVGGGVVLLGMSAWIGALMFKFRRPH